MIALLRRPRFACGLFYPVTVHFVHTPVHVSPAQAIFSGEREGVEQERTLETIWPSEIFTRDDIDSVDAQRGYRRHQVASVVRRMFPVEEVLLLTWKGQLRVSMPNNAPDPFFVGFASSFLAAAAWVATGSARHLMTWDPR